MQPANDLIQNGTISAINSTPTADSGSANSTVALRNLQGQSTLAIQVFGTYTGALTVQVRVDGSNWVTLGGTALLNVGTGAYSANIASGVQGVFQVDISSFSDIRVTALAAVTGSAAVSLRSNASTGMLALDAPLPTGANTIGNITTVTNVTGINGAASGGLTRNRVISAATTNSTLVKSTAGQIYTIHASNLSAAVKFLKLYNKATAPTVGTDVPVETYLLPAGQVTNIRFEDVGDPFSTGIGLGITGAYADTDTTVTAVGDVIVNTHYK